MADIDQRGFDNQPIDESEARYLEGREAAAYLGVKRATLYAYVSRGLVRSVVRGPRRRGYHRDDLERLKARHAARAGHGPVAAGALRFGEPVLASALTEITAGGPAYCGTLATELARRRVAFEDVAELLWAAGLDARGAPERRPAWPHVSPAPAGRADVHPILRLQQRVATLAAADPTRHLLAPAQELRRARLILAHLAAAAGGRHLPRRVPRTTGSAGASIAARLLAGFGVTPTPERRHAVDQALVLVADHELNMSTFGVRVAASAAADLYACVAAGLAIASGPRHSGGCDRVEALVDEAAARGVATVIRERSARGESFPGLGNYPLYTAGDPRTPALLRAAKPLAPRQPRLRVLMGLVAALRAAGAEPPNCDLGLVAVALAVGLPPGGAAALFVVGRAAGWMAHAFEQRRAGFILRPRALYVGPRS